MKNQQLFNAGLKSTTPRKYILQLLESSHEKHFSAEDVYKELVQKGKYVSLATIYRVLTQFEQAGIVIRHKFEEDRYIYELTEDDHHDHMICVDTGKIIEFKSETIEKAQEEIAKKHGYKLINHSHILYVKKNSPQS